MVVLTFDHIKITYPLVLIDVDYKIVLSIKYD